MADFFVRIVLGIFVQFFLFCFMFLCSAYPLTWRMSPLLGKSWKKSLIRSYHRLKQNFISSSMKFIDEANKFIDEANKKYEETNTCMSSMEKVFSRRP